PRKETCTHKTLEGNTHEKLWRSYRHYANGSRNRHDPRLRCSTQAGLRRLDQSEVRAALDARSRRLDYARLRNRSPPRRNVALRLAPLRWHGNEHARRISRNRAAGPARLHRVLGWRLARNP